MLSGLLARVLSSAGGKWWENPRGGGAPSGAELGRLRWAACTGGLGASKQGGPQPVHRGRALGLQMLRLLQHLLTGVPHGTGSPILRELAFPLIFHLKTSSGVGRSTELGRNNLGAKGLSQNLELPKSRHGSG